MNRLSRNADSSSPPRAEIGPHCIAVIVALAVAPACRYDDSGLAYEPPPNAEPLLGCNGVCHGNAASIAPPVDLQGNEDTASTGVGAHQAHLKIDPGWHLQVVCADCHKIPVGIGDPEHMDGDNVAELTFSDRSTADGAVQPTWENGQCANSYCHGATTSGGNLRTPLWTEPTGQPLACDTCHGFPPVSPPHEQETACGGCHTTVSDVPSPGPNDFLNPDSHINGQVDTADPEQPACDSCHGSNGQPAPPNDLEGLTDSTAVGAHRAHVGGSDWRQTLYCTQCHITPLNNDDPGHRDGDNIAEITFDTLNPTALYNPASATCTNLYCHGNGQSQEVSMVWNQDLADLRNNCSACHSTDGDDMSGRHEVHLDVEDGSIDCEACHYTVVDAQRNFLDPSLHINGNHEVVLRNNVGSWDAVNQRCQSGPCHGGNKKWLPGNDD